MDQVRISVASCGHLLTVQYRLLDCGDYFEEWRCVQHRLIADLAVRPLLTLRRHRYLTFYLGIPSLQRPASATTMAAMARVLNVRCSNSRLD